MKKQPENPLVSVSSQEKFTGVKPMFKKSSPTPPLIYFTAKAWQQMYTIIPLAHKMNTEVTWFTPLVYGEQNGVMTITVPEIFVPEQEVSTSTCDECDWAKPLDEAFERGYSMEDMRGWFHLHPFQSVEPSITDEEQTQDFIDGGWDRLMRGIFNKDGGYKLDYFDANQGENGTIFHDLHINIIQPEDFELDKMAQDFKERVKKKTYTNYYSKGNNYNKKNNVTTFKSNTTTNHQNDDGILDWHQDDLIFDGLIELSADINNFMAFVVEEDAKLYGEEADVVYSDQAEFGMSVIEALEDGYVTKEEVACMIRECKFKAADLQEFFPKYIKYLEELDKKVVN